MPRRIWTSRACLSRGCCSAENAEALKEKLQAAGYKAYTEKTQSEEGETTRVLIGPKLSRAQALELKQTVDQAYGVDALVYRFAP